jgi:hypothetical protein
MDDRTLLELAAKAAGIRVRWYIAGFVHVGSDGLDCGWWSPLTDDGDALRLAVKLGISVAQERRNGVVYCDTDERSIMAEADYNGDPCAATRRAIVRCAAALAQQE